MKNGLAKLADDWSFQLHLRFAVKRLKAFSKSQVAERLCKHTNEILAIKRPAS